MHSKNLLNLKRFLVLISIFMVLLFSFCPLSIGEVGSYPIKIDYLTSFDFDASLQSFLPLAQDHGSTAIDISGKGNHGFLATDNMEWLTYGGLLFKGTNNSLSINGSASLPSGSKTVVIKFKWNGEANDTEIYLYDDGWLSPGSTIIFIQPSTYRFYCEFNTGNSVHKSLWHEIVANTIYTAVFCFDGLNYSLWLNGEEKTSSLMESDLLGTNRSIAIGSNQAQNRRFFSGIMYTIQLFNRCLSKTEIFSLYSISFNSARFNAGSTHMISGWISFNDDSIQPNIANTEIYLNDSQVTNCGSFGEFNFRFELPTKAANYTYAISTDDSDEPLSYISIIVDRVTIGDFGASSVSLNQEATAWFELVSEFDGQPMTVGTVVLNGSLSAHWNLEELRWEYSETRAERYSLSVYVESIYWAEFGITALNPIASQSAPTISWEQSPWYIDVIKWVKGAGIVFWGIVVFIIAIVILVRLRILEIGIDKNHSGENEGDNYEI